MATIDEIFETMSNTTFEYLVIDPATREINVPETEQLFGVMNDRKSERKYFMCPRYVGDNLDLSKCYIQINFDNGHDEPDAYLVEDLAFTNDIVTFSWLLTDKVVAYEGDIKFSVYVSDGEREWNTTTAVGTSLEGLSAEITDVEDQTADAIVQLRQMIGAETKAVEEEGSKQVIAVHNASLAAQNEAAHVIAITGAEVLETIPDDYTKLSNVAHKAYNQKADAYVVSTGTGVSHEIHAQDCLLETILNGATFQSGSDEPTPTNVRPITGIGTFDSVLVLDGTENWVAAPDYASNTARLEIFTGGLCLSGVCSHFAPLDVPSLRAGTIGAYMLQTAKLFINYSSVSELKKYLAQQYAAGTPVTIWYKKATHDTTDSYFTKIETRDDSGKYRAIGVKIGVSQLYENDIVEPYVKSGCDVKMVFDGTEDWVDYAGLYFTLSGVVVASRPYIGFTTHWPYRYDYSGKFMFVGDNVVYCGTELYNLFDDLNAWKSYLAEQYAAGTPVTLWYRSMRYTDDNDQRICKVTRKSSVICLDGSMPFVASSDGAYWNGPNKSALYAPDDAIVTCSHFPNSVFRTNAVNDYFYTTPEKMAAYGFTTVDDLNEYILAQAAAGTPVTIIYRPNEWTCMAFEAAGLRTLHSLPETVSSVGELSVTYPQDTNYTISKLISAIQALGGTV